MTLVDEFVGYMSELEAIGKNASALNDGDDPDKKDKAQKYLEAKGLETIAEVMGKDFEPDKLNPEQRGKYSNEGIKLRQKMFNERAGRLLNSELDNILSGINPKLLEELALQKEIADRGMVKGYEELLGKYGEYFAARSLKERHSSGKRLDPEDSKMLYAGAAEEVAKEIMKNSEKFSKDTLENMGQVARMVVQTRGINKEEYIGRGVQKIVADNEKELRDYETKS